MKEEFDIIVIGAGVIGCAIAGELCRYGVHILVVERHGDVCEETSKANHVWKGRMS